MTEVHALFLFTFFHIGRYDDISGECTREEKMTFGEAVRFVRKCTVNELILLEHLFEQRKVRREEERARREMQKQATAMQLL